MNKKLFLLPIIVLVLTSFACIKSAQVLPTSTSEPTLAVEPTLAPQASSNPSGLWISDSSDQTMTKQVLVLTEKSIYLAQTGNWANVKADEGKEGGSHEEFYEIVSADPSAQTMVVLLKWVRTDGRFGGFDMPTKTFKYQIDADTIRFSFGPEGEYPTSADSDPYIRQ